MLVVVARGVLAACLLLFLQSPSIRFDSGRNLFLLENWSGAAQLWPERGKEVFTVSVDAPNVPPLLGRYRIENKTLIFEPQFPLQPGVSYRAVAKIPGATAPVFLLLRIPKPNMTPTTVVDRVYPSSNVLPENQLKFYIHFSSPMARGSAYDHVSLVDASGKKVEKPFLELGEELWDPSGRRFTLFIDPGRIKRGLLSHHELGVALLEGKRYSLVVSKEWKDAQGRLLASDFKKTFTVGPADRNTVDLKSWTVRAPAAGTRNVLTVVFPEPMDHAILERELDVVTEAGAVIKGGVSVGSGEKSWIFTPDAAWKSGTYSIRAGTSLADLAGNMIDRPFEIDVFERVDNNLDRTTRSLQFKIN
ncbi:MAG TPA: Ig-like domain-containing protein [Terriglobia bacterium]|nr:Ig-like domain-containing protein [Terriglobia bacterium]